MGRCCIHQSQLNLCKMQIVVAITLFAAYLGTIESTLLGENPMLLENREICKVESGVSADVLNKAIQYKEIQYMDKGLQSYGKCMLQKSKAMDEAGKVDFSEFIARQTPASKAKFGPILSGCQDDVDLGVKAMRVYLCLKENAKEDYEFA